MVMCMLCQFEAPLDDAAVLRADGCCICLRCYGRETETSLRMPKLLRRQLIAALAELEAA